MTALHIHHGPLNFGHRLSEIETTISSYVSCLYDMFVGCREAC